MILVVLKSKLVLIWEMAKNFAKKCWQFAHVWTSKKHIFVIFIKGECISRSSSMYTNSTYLHIYLLRRMQQIYIHRQSSVKTQSNKKTSSMLGSHAMQVIACLCAEKPITLLTGSAPTYSLSTPLLSPNRNCTHYDVTNALLCRIVK